MEISESAKPFAAAILALDDRARPDMIAQFRPEEVGDVHRAFALHLFALTLMDRFPDAEQEAEKHRAVVEAAGALSLGWEAHAYLRARFLAAKAIGEAMRPTQH
ncbi:hypothetical protein GCM10028813_09700 [Ramlibacter alkalitolerans]